MTAPLTKAQAIACLEKAGLRVSDAELERVMAFHSVEALALLRSVEAARYEVPALAFDPVPPLRSWPGPA
jgi:hypothetical protein